MYSRVYVEITNICNMNCSFCRGHSRTPRQMTEAEYAHVLEQLQGTGIRLSISTKSDLILRDLDLIRSFPGSQKVK